MRRFLDRLYDVAGALAGVVVLAIFVVMIGAAVMRQLGLATGGTDDIVSWLTAAAGFLAMASAFRHGDFVRVVLLIDHLPSGQRRAFEIACLSIATAFVGFLALAGVRFVHESYAFNDIANGMIPMPLWIPQLSFAAGALLLLIAMIDELVAAFQGRPQTYVRAVEERHARGDFSEDI